MTEPFPSTGQSPSEQNPLDDPTLYPDPLLENGWFIDAEAAVSHTMADAEPAATSTTTTEPHPGEDTPIMATPVSQRRGRRPAEDSSERPAWLPEGWNMTVKVRTTGATAGTSDRYFISPLGQRFRSKVEVMHYLETGSKRKNGRKLKDESDATPSEKPSENPSEKKKRKTKATSNVKDFSDLKFDFEHPPQSVTWVQGDGSSDDWEPSTGDDSIPASTKKEWGAVYSQLSRLEKSNAAS